MRSTPWPRPEGLDPARHYNQPRSAKLVVFGPATMMWSSTRTSTVVSALRSASVSIRSAWLGSGTPLGWLCALCAPNRYVPKPFAFLGGTVQVVVAEAHNCAIRPSMTSPSTW